jgi:hypothetical protein
MLAKLSGAFSSIQKSLFPALEEELGELSDRQREFVIVIESLNVDAFFERCNWGRGRKPSSRLSIFKAFEAKSVFGYPTTRALIENLNMSPRLRRLCGWEYRGQIPSEATFSRAFAEFASQNLLSQIHVGMVKDKIGDRIFCHLSRDATSIKAREKACRKKMNDKEIKKAKTKKRRGRPLKEEYREKVERRLEVQPARSWAENLAALPKECDWGCKRDSNGKKMSWKGYKLHLDTVDNGIPVSAVLTSASVHDSQVAIPLAQITFERITNFYDLMDSAYDAPEIHQASYQMGHVPIIDHNKRNGEKKEFDPAKKVRYKERSTAERTNSELKDNYGAQFIRVRGYAKVLAHLMFGVIALTAKQMYSMLC